MNLTLSSRIPPFITFLSLEKLFSRNISYKKKIRIRYIKSFAYFQNKSSLGHPQEPMFQ